LETPYNRTDNKVPSINKHKKEQFERKRYEYRREHHHAHGEEYAGYNHIDNQER
jgi:hypothetical protein